MKLALRYIPTEVWVDVFIFPWISRKRLGKIVHKFRNRKFIEILQYCLHDRGKRTLEDVDLDKDAIIPCTPMPENIKFFEQIMIGHFDSQAVDFLRRISTLFINDVNINLRLRSAWTNSLRTILDHLAPLLHGIHSLTIDQTAVPLLEQYFTPKFDQIKMLSIDFDSNKEQVATKAFINFSLNWLTSGGNAEPKFMSIGYPGYEGKIVKIVRKFIKAIKQQFFSAKRPCTFAIELCHSCYQPCVDLDFRLDLQNNLGEQLHGEFNEAGLFDIYRHPINFAINELEVWIEQTVDKRWASSLIELCGELTIGPIAANNEMEEAAGGEDDGPSTSKKPKFTV